MSVGHAPDHPAWTPVKKFNPTAEEKEEARRRISGSWGPDIITGLNISRPSQMTPMGE